MLFLWVPRMSWRLEVWMVEKILRRPEVERVTGKSRSQIYEDMQHGRFPKPIRLTPKGHSVGWLETEIAAWLRNRVAERDGGKMAAT
jgi:prophage regulatory protein